jgi:hypothetical protein
MKLIVTKDHDYRFPSGSLVALKAHPDPITTKREIAENAVALGFGEAVDEPKAEATK